MPRADSVGGKAGGADGTAERGFWKSLGQWILEGRPDGQSGRFTGVWSTGLRILARVIATCVIVFFALCLRETIRLGSTTTSLQRMVTGLTDLRTARQTAETGRREAELRNARFLDPAAVADADDRLAAHEAKLNLQSATDDFEAAANRYYAAVCAAGVRLADIGTVSDWFMPDTQKLGECPPRMPRTANGQVANAAAPQQAPDGQGRPAPTRPAPAQPTSQTIASPEDRIEAVIVMIDQYNVLAASYILPILFGMLGAMVFALRDMVRNPDHMGDLPKATGYILRIFLGAIFGLIVGYVNFAGAGTATLAASPLLLSLVAGFATDAVMSLLDRIASTFGERLDERVEQTSIVVTQAETIGGETRTTAETTIPGTDETWAEGNTDEVRDQATAEENMGAGSTARTPPSAGRTETPEKGLASLRQGTKEDPTDHSVGTPSKRSKVHDAPDAHREAKNPTGEDHAHGKGPIPMEDPSAVSKGVEGLTGTAAGEHHGERREPPTINPEGRTSQPGPSGNGGTPAPPAGSTPDPRKRDDPNNAL